jgi:uncharacterized cupredoxin-like copper-binding protein
MAGRWITIRRPVAMPEGHSMIRIAAAFLVVGLVAGCAGAGSSPVPSPAGTSAPTASSAPAGSPAASTMSMAPSGGATAGASVTAPPNATTVHVLDFRIEPAALTIKGTAVTLFVTNDGPTVHNVTIRDAAGKVLLGTPDLRPGESAVLSGTLQPGTYVTFCSLPGHESLGTKGSLVVTA